MGKWEVAITMTVTAVVEVDAVDRSQAEAIALQMADDCKLDFDDDGARFDVDYSCKADESA
jgi:hypothetical protein